MWLLYALLMSEFPPDFAGRRRRKKDELPAKLHVASSQPYACVCVPCPPTVAQRITVCEGNLCFSYSDTESSMAWTQSLFFPL